MAALVVDSKDDAERMLDVASDLATPLRYVGVPPTCRLGRTRTLDEGIQGETGRPAQSAGRSWAARFDAATPPFPHFAPRGALTSGALSSGHGLPTKEKPGCWTRRRAFGQVRQGSNIQLLPYPLVSGDST